MAKNEYYKTQLTLDPRTEKMISGSQVIWPKTKEEIWEGLWVKAEEIRPVSGNRKTISMRFVRYAAAAALILFVSISSAMYFFKKTIITSVSLQTEMILPDRSVVTLSEHSSLSYKPLLWPLYRKVELDGEGMFDVTKGSKFEVLSKKGKTSVLGTRFTVYSRNNNYQVTCISGKVRVTEFSRQNEAIIKGGQKAILKSDGNFQIMDIENIKELPGSSKAEGLDAELDVLFSGSTEKPLLNNNAKAITDNKDQAVETKSMQPSPETPSTEPGTTYSPEPVEIFPQNESNVNAKEEREPEQVQKQLDQNNQGSGNLTAKERFRNSLSEEQIRLLENQEMSREEKRKAFMGSLSPEQMRMLDEQTQEQARQGENANPESGKNDELREQQRMQLQEQIRQNSRKQKSEQQDMQKGTGNQTRPVDGAGPVNENNPGNGKDN